MTSLVTTIRNVLGEALVSAETAESSPTSSGTELWVDVVYETDDDNLDAKMMMGVIAAVQNWEHLDGRLPTVNFISSREASEQETPGRLTA